MIGWIRARGATEISREDVRREALSQRVNAAGADEVILALEQAGVLREVDDEEEYPGPRPPGAALAGQSGAARKTRCANCGKVPASPAQLREVSSSYDDGGVGSLGSRAPAKSLAQIAEK